MLNQMILQKNRRVHSRNLRFVFVISPVKRGRDEPLEFLQRNPCRRIPFVLNIDRVQYAIRRPSLVGADARGGLIHLHNFSARIRCARSFAVFVEIDAVPFRTFRELG
jgi:hypothetical protein